MRKYDIVKIIIINILFIILHLEVFSLENPSSISPSTQGDTLLLPPLRRIGIDIPETNIDKFRVFMRKQDRLLYGLPAFPYNQSDIQRLIAENVADEVKNTGRFWDLSLTEFVKMLPLAGSDPSSTENQKIDKLKKRLALDYNIDAWLRPYIYFAPDQTLVRLVIKGSELNASTWAREDIILEAQANEQKIKNAISQALARLVNTVGHDGRVTYIRDNLLTIDFGIERGIVRGETLMAGYVILTSFHPQTGEFLRAQRVSIHELRVLESRQGSSLCQIVASDRLAFDQALKILGTNDAKMLVWRKTKELYKDGWREPYNPETAPILGAAEEGFGIPSQQAQNENTPRSMMPPLVFEKETQAKESLDEKTNTKITQQNIIDKKSNQNKLNISSKYQTEQQGLPYAIPQKQENEASLPKPVAYKKAIINRPDTWIPYSGLLGSGLTIGSVNGRNSDFPQTILNKIEASGYFDIDTTVEFKLIPSAQFSYFNGNSLTGSSFYLMASLLNTIVHSSVDSSLSVGGGLEYTTGTLSYSCNCTTNTDLTHIGINVNSLYEDNISSFGTYNILGGLSLIDFAQGYPIWSLKGNVRPFYVFPKEMVFDASLKRYYTGWFEFSIGVSWDFLPEYNYLKVVL
ncbi:hypothetical protein [Silvanigrella aquatica]|uniref:Uncharacterized protein n=1 Tax=Silvanigrella aquatica TaxID=1915309 RepID=A0A1L4D1L9_9BACT|nr:hypothetical protein [Silvanigrella aquatica]APJ04105.1 hypothetical protein AXG55_09370 [Silvanigrella aquatica]